MLRDERPRASAEAGPGMGAGADLPQSLDRSRVPGARWEGPPEQVLVEGDRAGIRVAVMEVDVCGLQVGRREHNAPEDRRLEVRRVRGDPCLDPVRVALAQLLGPPPMLRVELAGRVAFDVPGQL